VAFSACEVVLCGWGRHLLGHGELRDEVSVDWRRSGRMCACTSFFSRRLCSRWCTYSMNVVGGFVEEEMLGNQRWTRSLCLWAALAP